MARGLHASANLYKGFSSAAARLDRQKMMARASRIHGRVSGPSSKEDGARARQSSSGYGHRFAAWATVASGISIFILSMSCAVTRFHESETSSNHLNLANRRRFLQPLNDDSSSMTTLACEDIFRSIPVAISAQQSGNVSAVSMQSQDNNRVYLCQYARNCDGDWPSSTLLPLILCLGLDNQDSAITVESHIDSPNFDIHDYSNNPRNNRPLLRSLFVHFLLPPTILLYLYLLFRLLATTADSYFSPALEVFSCELGLPPRFAGATLLALGNGSPDLGSTINAILLWNESAPDTNENYNHLKGEGGGWTMSLGSLTGGGMFVGTIVSGLIVQSCDGIPCRGAFLRDVSMYALSIMAVWHVLESRTVTRSDALLLLGMWVGYVSIVLVSDLYHRKVTLPRLHGERKKTRQSLNIETANRLSGLVRQAELSTKQNDRDANEVTPLGNFNLYGKEEEQQVDLNEVNDILSGQCYTTALALPPSIDVASAKRVRLSVTDRFAMLMSNYDPASVKFDLSSRSSTISNDDSETNTIHNVIHQIHSIRRTSIAIPKNDDLVNETHCAMMEEENTPVAPERLLSFPEETEEESVINEAESRSFSIEMVADMYRELIYQASCYWETYIVKEPSRFERFGCILELPVTLLRTLTIPVPCEDHYNKTIAAISTAMSPFWIMWYLVIDFSLSSMIFILLAFITAFAIICFGNDEKLPLVAAVPLSLYGFFIAATWIDVIGNNLVGLLQFLGTICRIPAPILGVTVLAWGNSLGDLSANVAMARKGMPDMATTANFAGPAFNLLVGTSIGFLSLQHELQSDSVFPVTLTPSIRIGFSFNIINCFLITLCAAICNLRIPYRYSYVFFALYFSFIAISLMTLV
ncbi:hypothetical protein ACHAW6_009056 [Cyclotella cf. meneghiniana]